jgi:hypothetical protein
VGRKRRQDGNEELVLCMQGFCFHGLFPESKRCSKFSPKHFENPANTQLKIAWERDKETKKVQVKAGWFSGW